MPARRRFRHAGPLGPDSAPRASLAVLPAPAGEAFVHYRDRREAGRVLAGWVQQMVDDETTVVAIAAGGVPVSLEVADALGAPLDLIFVHGVTLPACPGRRVGAIAEDGTLVLDSRLVSRLDMPLHELADLCDRERSAAARRGSVCRGDEPARPLRGRTVVLVDDGLDSGLAATAAVRSIRRHDPASVVVAVPVASRSAVRRLGAEADHVVAPVMPPVVGGRGRWYRSFPTVSDAEVANLMRGAERR